MLRQNIDKEHEVSDLSGLEPATLKTGNPAHKTLLIVPCLSKDPDREKINKLKSSLFKVHPPPCMVKSQIFYRAGHKGGMSI